jgi:hypothetical protein
MEIDDKIKAVEAMLAAAVGPADPLTLSEVARLLRIGMPAMKNRLCQRPETLPFHLKPNGSKVVLFPRAKVVDWLLEGR